MPCKKLHLLGWNYKACICITFTYKVKEYTQKRVSAKLVSDYLINLTPQEEIDKLLTPKFPDFGSRERGTGRPTKKERRTIDNFRKKT